MAEEMGKVVLVGKRGSGRSDVANMLVGGQGCPTGNTSICETYEGRGWTVVDTLGFGEPLGDTVPDEYARTMAVDFLNEVKGRYTHIIFLIDWYELGLRDSDTTPLMWETFLEIFSGGEENFVVLVTKAPSFLLESFREQAEKMFPKCKHILFLEQQELERLGTEMREMLKASQWVEPDIFKMGDEEIEEKAGRITRLLTRGRMITMMQNRITFGEISHQISHQITFGKISGVRFKLDSCFMPRTEWDIAQEKKYEILDFQKEMENMGKKVKFYRRQCQHLLQQTLEASNECVDLCDDASGKNWQQISSSLDRLLHCMNAGMALLRCCGGENEHEVALIFSTPTPFRDSFSKFALVLRDLNWTRDVFCFLVRNPAARKAARSKRQSWLSKFSWCEKRRRLTHNKNMVVDKDDVKSCLEDDVGRQARDQEDLLSYLQSFQSRRLKSDVFGDKPILINRLQGDAHFGDENRVPECFLIPQKLQYETIAHVGGGSYKKVTKCKWIGMEVAIATFQASKVELEAEAGLLARVQHPNVITFIGCTYDEEKQQGCLVTEFMGRTLKSLIEKHYRYRYKSSYLFTLPDSIEMLLQIVEAMIHVHECGVIHRDLKALNCLVNGPCHARGSYVVKLIDFGESKLGTSKMGCSFKSANKGTRAWMAPEVYGTQGEETKYSFSADVYSFGMTCYEILMGEEPFGNIRGRALTEMVRDGVLPKIPHDCPDVLRELMTRCWAHNPEHRPTFKDIQQALWTCKLSYAIWESL